MPRYNPESDILVQGINAIVRVDMDDPNGSNPQEIGFVESYSVRNNITLNRAECVGEMLPVSIDPSAVAVTINLSGFVPTKALITQGIDSVKGGGKVMIKNFCPNVDKLIDTKAVTKVPYLDIWDIRHKSIIGKTNWLTCSSYEDSGQGKGYIKSTATFEGIGYDNGPDYESVI